MAYEKLPRLPITRPEISRRPVLSILSVYGIIDCIVDCYMVLFVVQSRGYRCRNNFGKRSVDFITSLKHNDILNYIHSSVSSQFLCKRVSHRSMIRARLSTTNPDVFFYLLLSLKIFTSEGKKLK